MASAEAEPPDLVTSAVQLRCGSGIEAVRKIRLRQDVPVLFITQQVEEVEVEEPDALVVKKPFLAAHLPVERILFGSDWPHAEGMSQPRDFFENVASFSLDDQRRIMRDNARELTLS